MLWNSFESECKLYLKENCVHIYAFVLYIRLYIAQCITCLEIIHKVILYSLYLNGWNALMR